MDAEAILAGHARALERRRPIEPIWQACYDHVLPAPQDGPALFDATAADAVEQLAASLLAELTPPWSRWFGLAPARPLQDTARGHAAALALEDAADTLQRHLDRSNFAVEMHQAFLDLVIIGTGLLMVEEAPLGEASAFRFTAVPMRMAVLEEGPDGRLSTVYRQARLTAAALRRRFPEAVLPPELLRAAAQGDATAHPVLEAVLPDRGGIRYHALLIDDPLRPLPLAEGSFAENPCIAFRWMKVPGELYGRGPVMKALPDIRTANKVVELILKNASIAATGIWQAEDDGVLNPATIKLTPGAIIPKAPGSAGLTPLAAPGNFDVSQLVLEDLRTRIRGALLADRLGPAQDVRMTATEVLERSAQTARLLGATYGRLQTELLTPLVMRCLGILRRRGELPPLLVADGREIALRYESPLARVQGRADAANTLLFLESVGKLGGSAAAQLDTVAATRWLARTLGAPAEVLLPSPVPQPLPNRE
ncbi:portal protein [Siccirubricoccus sp. KC 17139]|uniref:Portal protein n=1 Tax=Siccirubricoccus soli TaxID=2899147 RepID=A0ABT1DD16_9PROT|nr:portal protein [Siccirubricoccus soli]MCO6419110.1 portal protein [Siccirubricoccus soli]MCP2685245.1 portal protein [Siccirubricoccus soli]